MRKLIETSKVEFIDNDRTKFCFILTSDDGLVFTQEVIVTSGMTHKAIIEYLEEGRQALVKKRIWLNARKALSLEDIQKLDETITSKH